ncbi:MAG: hypothetical protein HQL82_14905 [Magnetococcales bacterium]|nr:hypothetical protein [Magnetococcales bacterium]
MTAVPSYPDAMNDSAPFSSRPMGFLAVLLLALAVGIVVLAAVECFLFGNWTFDNYQILLAARALRDSGIPQLEVMPQSIVGLDLLFWNHLLPVYSLRFWMVFLDPGIDTFYFSIMIDTLLVIGVTGWLLRTFLIGSMRSRGGLGLLWALVVWEPLGFNVFFSGNVVVHWAFLSSLLALIALRRHLLHRGGGSAFATGLGAGGTFCGIPSLGIPVMTGFVLVFTLETALAPGRTERWRSLGPFLVGMGVIPLLLAGPALWNMGVGGLQEFVTTVRFYGDVLSEPGVERHVLRMGYFLSSLWVPHLDPSLLPVGLTAAVLNWRDRERLPPLDRALTRAVLVFALSWVALALLVSTHFYAARMDWLLPLLLHQIVLLWQRREARPGVFAGYLLFALWLVVVQRFHHAFLAPRGPLWAGVSAALSMTGGAVLLGVLARWGGQLSAGVQRRRWAITCLAAGLLYLPLVWERTTGLVQTFRKVEAAWREAERPFTRTIRITRQAVDRELPGGGWVGTNVAVPDLFSDRIALQKIYFYRGLFGGALERPLDRLMFFARAPEYTLDDLPGVTVGDHLRFRGHVYHLEKAVPLERGMALIVGRPAVPLPGVRVKAHPEDSPAELLADYFAWRRRHGLPTL